ncbi:restriction endonuclease subunit S [uncultured Thiodictyon sp.]|jgi:type I restriction enzyme S subunit|uniref:restriction endonuclease subunit S n=1 Tax=uncultured Thiodictyon sp. TaxID=1846217 RepID=UPI002600ECD7|nr:restriction endonuclease subunit S [uncultured Thiodictyon sp.]
MDNWPTVQLGDVTDLLTGFPFKSERYTEDFSDPQLLRGDNVAQGVLRWENAKRWPSNATNEVTQYWLMEDDVILAMDRPWIEAGLKYAAIRKSDLPALLVQRVTRLRGSATLNTSYLKYVIGSRAFTEYVLAIQTGTAVPHISGGQIKRFQFRLPPIETQLDIAQILGALDDKIELNRRINETLEAMARALFKDWFVDFGPTRAKQEGMEPYLTPELWSLFPERLDVKGTPEGWDFATVGQLFTLTMGQSPPGSTYNDAGNGLPFFQGRTDFGFRYPERRIFCSAPARIAEAEDTLVSVRAPVGDINLAWEKCCIGRGVAALRHPKGYRSFTYHTAWALQLQLQQYEHTGTVFGAINKKQFESLSICSPSQELLASFEDVVSPLDDRVKGNIIESRTLAQVRDLLLPKLMSGEIRVKDAEKTLESHL